MAGRLSSTKNAFSVLVIALVVALYLFANSTFFEMEQFEWTGLKYLKAEQLDLYLNYSTSNVWRLDTRELVADLIDHPWIEKAKATWRWPNRIIIDIEERTPIAQMPTAGGWVLLDCNGELLPAVEAESIYSLPIITSLDISSSEQLMAAARIINMIPDNLQGIISEWNVSKRSFITRTGAEVLMGQPVDLGDKFILLEKIIEDLNLRNEQAKFIDLRVPKNPVINLLSKSQD